MKYTTVDRNSAGFTNVAWGSYRHFKVRITQDNLTNAITALNAKGGSLSTELDGWTAGITLVGINQEIGVPGKE